MVSEQLNLLSHTHPKCHHVRHCGYCRLYEHKGWSSFLHISISFAPICCFVCSFTHSLSHPNLPPPILPIGAGIAGCVGPASRGHRSVLSSCAWICQRAVRDPHVSSSGAPGEGVCIPPPPRPLPPPPPHHPASSPSAGGHPGSARWGQRRPGNDGISCGQGWLA